ncbi:MAG TPA: phosphoribosylamine--glycine ligase [Nocardioidaceae bacterium]|nr:phosphoribosylamine--glycine ligase [Nocardioidaceae bacterium]
MRVLVIGSGGREHALVLALARDLAVDEVHAAPGNPGMAAVARLHAVDPLDGAQVGDLATSLGADLVVIGPEAPLVAGVADAVRAAGVPCFGAGAEAARLEGSKAFAKEVMAAAGVPTALAHICAAMPAVEAALDAFGPPYVVKDDGLAAGKGVVVTDDRESALAHARACLGGASGADAAGRMVVVEEFLDGPEVSVFAVTDGHTVVPLVPAQDFKRLGDDDTGPNTGGMGAYAPLSWVPDDLVADVTGRVLQPTVAEMARRGAPFTGLLYAGLALSTRGLKVVEFNARFGDPETQVVLPLLESSLGTLLYAAATDRLGDLPPLRWSRGAAVTVVVASPGYPAAPRTGDPVTGLDQAARCDGVHLVHAGTAVRDGKLVTAGGRVLAVTAVGADVDEARARAYMGVGHVRLDGAQFRSDIAAGRWDEMRDTEP